MPTGKTIIIEPGTHVVDEVVIREPITDDSQAATKKYVDDNSGGTPSFAAITGQPDDNANLDTALSGKLAIANNLSDLDDVPDAQDNIGKSTDPTLGDNDDDLIPSQKAVKSYVDDGFLKKQNFKQQNYATAPLTANATSMVNAHAADGTTVTAAAQPDLTRTLQVKADGAATDDVVIHGTDFNNGVISETITLDGTNPVKSKRAFKTVTGIDLPTGAYNVSVGTSKGLGMDGTMDSYGLIVSNEWNAGILPPPARASLQVVGNEGNADMSYDPDEISKNWFEPDNAPNGSRCYIIFYNGN